MTLKTQNEGEMEKVNYSCFVTAGYRFWWPFGKLLLKGARRFVLY